MVCAAGMPSPPVCANRRESGDDIRVTIWNDFYLSAYAPYPPTPFHPRQGGKGGLILLLVSGTG